MVTLVRTQRSLRTLEDLILTRPQKILSRMNTHYFLDTDHESTENDVSKLLPELVGYKLNSEMDLKLIKNIFRETTQKEDTNKEQTDG